MNGAHPSHDLLQRHHDGDLTGQEAAELHVHLDACDQCQAELASLGRLGQLLRRSATEDQLGYGSAAAEPDFTRMFAEIQKAVAEPEPIAEGATRPNVVPLRATKKAGPHWLQRTAPTMGALALAAAALLMVYRSDSSSPQAELQDQREDVVASVNRSEIVKVEFGSNAGQVFDIPLADGSSVPVVWIDDDDDEEE